MIQDRWVVRILLPDRRELFNLYVLAHYLHGFSLRRSGGLPIKSLLD